MMKRKNILLYIALTFMLLLSGCNRLKDVRLLSYSVASITPNGLRGANAELTLSVENPGSQFTVYDVDGVLYYKGQEFVKYTAEPITIKARTTQLYPLFVNARLGSNFNLVQLFYLMSDYDINDFSTDINGVVKTKVGFKKKVNMKGLPVKNLMEAFK